VPGETDSKHDIQEIVGESRALKQLLAQTARVAASNATALILGEAGSGGWRSGLDTMKKAPPRLVVNFTDRDHYRPERSMNLGLKALRKPGESKVIFPELRKDPHA
jgi:hypothetical protein